MRFKPGRWSCDRSRGDGVAVKAVAMVFRVETDLARLEAQAVAV